MARDRTRFSKIVNAAVFILMEIAAVAMLGSSSELQNIWINRASRRCLAALWGAGESIRSHFSLYEQNEELVKENFRLQEEIRQYKIKMESIEDKGTIVNKVYRYTPAKVVKMSRNTAHNYIILDKGSEHGIKPHSGIVSSNGVVGVVEAVDKHFAYGLTLMNNGITIGARLKGTEVTGPLVWDGRSSNGAFLKDIALHHEIHPGDTVVTSGYSSIFPPDVPMGIATNVEIINGSSLKVEVKLFQDFDTLHYVTIVENTLRSEIESLESDEIREEEK